MIDTVAAALATEHTVAVAVAAAEWQGYNDPVVSPPPSPLLEGLGLRL